MSASNLVFILTGSIAAYKACDVLSQLVQRGHRVRVVATPSALKFVGAATLEGLTGQAVLSDLFASGDAMAHIDLTKWADAVVVCPATANTLNRLAAGLADDLVGALFLAHDRKKPWLMAPAMNPAMWEHPATVNAVGKLHEWGVRILPVEKGRMACGDLGEGRLLAPIEIVAAIEAALSAPAKRWRILITGGGTNEPIDGVRVLGNTSTGHTSALLAEGFIRAGHEVVLLRAKNAMRPALKCREEVFGTFAELDEALTRLLNDGHFDVVIHAAAVSDFGVESLEVNGVRQLPGSGKINSDAALAVHLRPQPKLVSTLRARSASPFKLVAFKLTRGATCQQSEAAVKNLFAHSGADLVVANDLNARGKDPEYFPFEIYRPDLSLAAHGEVRTDLASTLGKILTHPQTP